MKEFNFSDLIWFKRKSCSDISIYKNGYLKLNNSFFEKFIDIDLEKLNYMVLFYSKEKNAIIFKFQEDKTNISGKQIKINKKIKNISCKRAFLEFGLNVHEICNQYEVEKINIIGYSNIGEAFVIFLKSSKTH